MEPMEFLSSPEIGSGQSPKDNPEQSFEADSSHGSGIFQTVRVETEALPPIVELGRKLLAKAQQGDAEAVRDLMRQGAPFTTDWLGTSALHFACQFNHVDVVELLLKAGISKDSRNKVDRTPLHVTAQEGHTKVLKLLLDFGVDVDSTDMLRMSSLHWAAENGHEECVKMLLEHGADPVAVNKFDKTPDQISFDNDRLDICHIIQEYAENPLRNVHRREAKEKQKRAAAAHKAALELEKANKNPTTKFIVNGEKVLKTQGQEIKEVRILKLPKRKVQPKVIFENEVAVTNGLQTTPQKAANGFQTSPQNIVPNPTPMINQTQLMTNNREKILQMLQAQGITMLPTDESTTAASAMQSGQKIILTEAGKMALNLTEKPIMFKPHTSLPVKGMIKFPPGLLKGKKVISIRADQLINMKNQQKVIIQTDKKFKPVNMDIAQNKTLVPGKHKVEVLVRKRTANDQPQVTPSVVDEPPHLDTPSFSLERLLEDHLQSEQSVSRESTTNNETEIQRIRQEMEEMKRQMKILQEQYTRKEQEAQDYKREALEYKKLVDVLQSSQ